MSNRRTDTTFCFFVFFTVAVRSVFFYCGKCLLANGNTILSFVGSWMTRTR